MAKTRINNEGNIRLRADGLYEVRVTLGTDFITGKQKRVSRYAHSKEEAVRSLNQMSLIRETAPKSFQSVTLGEWLDLCLDVYMKPTLKQSTYLSYESYIRVHFKPALGNIYLRDLHPRTLQQYYNYKIEEEGLSPKTVINLNLFLHKALTFAVNEGYIQTNPAEALNLSRGQKPETEILTRDEQAKLMHGSYSHRYGVFIRLTLFTGIRIGELLGLRWEDIDFTASKMYIRRTLNRLNKTKKPTVPGEPTTEIVIQTPKSQNSIRSIPLLPAVLEDLRVWRNIQMQDKAVAGDAYQESGYIVTNELGGYIEPRTFRDYYLQILTIAGLRHFKFHALRHTFASRALEQGMDSKTLSAIMGHYSVSFTLDTYAHVLDDHKQVGMALMGDLFEMQPSVPAEIFYPVLVTTFDDFSVELVSLNFPDVNYVGDNMAEGLQFIKESIHEKSLTEGNYATGQATVPPVLESNQMLLNLSL